MLENDFQKSHSTDKMTMRQDEILSQVYKSKSTLINKFNKKKKYEEEMTIHDILEASINPLKGKVYHSFLSKNKNSILSSFNIKKKFHVKKKKKKKNVTLAIPFINIVNIESYKTYNLKMTYNEYENIATINPNFKTCKCKNLCIIV